jgi:dUTP pyrophosphatase
MNEMIVKFVKTHEDAVLPNPKHRLEYSNGANKGDTGFDLTSVEDKIIPAKSASTVDTGLKLASMPPNLWCAISPRSGLGFKNGIQPHLGVIDNGYTGDLGVKLYNFSDQDYKVSKGDRIAQLVFYPLITPFTDWAQEVDNTERGDKGFGSSGK